MKELNQQFWTQRWEEGSTGWDIGYACPAIVSYLNRVENKDLDILIPGAGNAYEAEWLWENGFHKVDVVDYAAPALRRLKEKFPDYPAERLIQSDFFALKGSYDLILEQTFFCALDPSLRPEYARKMHELLRPGGMLVGVMFDFPLTHEGPPFGGSVEEYLAYFEPYFEVVTMGRCKESIKPRDGRELWVELRRK